MFEKRVQRIVKRLERFKLQWLSNPAAMAEFAGIIEDVHMCPSSDHDDSPLWDWIDAEKDRHDL